MLLFISALLSLTDGAPTLDKRVSADATYLEILPGDLVPYVETTQETEEEYIIYASYVGSDELPQQAYLVYATRDFDVQTNLDKPVVVKKLQPLGNTKNVAFYFYKAPEDAAKADFDDSVTKITIPDGTQLEANTYYSGVYAGIRFKGDTVFERDGDVWSCVIEDEPTPTGATVALGENTVTDFIWNETENRLEAKIALPYSSTETARYEGNVVYSVSGAEYSGTAIAQQEAEILTIAFENSEILKGGTGISITLSDTTLISEELGTLALTGEITYYGYSDGVWLTEEYIEIRKIIGEETSVERLALDSTAYTLPTCEKAEEKLFIGWKYQGALYRTGDELPLENGTKVFETEAQYLSYSLMDGASIRYGKNASDSGIRFTAKLYRSDFEKNAGYIRSVGIILMPNDLITEDKEFVLSNYNGDKQAERAYREAANITFDSTGLFKMNVAIVNVLDGNYNRVFSARAYAVVEYATGADYVWEDKIENRSVYQVATNALNDENRDTVFTEAQITLLESYVNGVVNVTYDGTTATIVCAAETPAINAATVSISDGVVTITLTTEVTRFFAITYNGVRIRGAGQVSGDGTLIVTFLENTV